jgi:hypothetical protein
MEESSTSSISENVYSDFEKYLSSDKGDLEKDGDIHVGTRVENRHQTAGL